MTGRLSSSTIEAARSIPIAEAVGAYAPNLRRQGRELVGACPVCGGRDRFAVHLVRNVWNCRGCGLGGDVIALVRHVEGGAFVDAVEALVGDGYRQHEPDPIQQMQARARRIEQEGADEADRVRRTAKANAIWASSVPPHGTIAETYIGHRGLSLFDGIDGTIRFHPTCRWETSTRPAMVAAMRDVVTGELKAIHRTALNADGQKLDRKMLGPSGGTAIMFDEAGPELVVGEGIESAWTGRQMGLGPTWALGSAGEIERLPVLAGVERLTILAENDESGASDRAVLTCGVRWQSGGRSVSTIRPPAGCSDLNDILRSAAR